MKHANILLIGLVLFLAAVGLVFAQGGGGPKGGDAGKPMMGDHGYGMGPGMMHGDPGFEDDLSDDDLGPGPGYGHRRGMMRGQGGAMGANLTPEQRQQLHTARQEFYNETQPLRHQIREKQFALQAQLNQQEPDEAAVDQLQQELSDLQQQFDQLRVQHQLEVSNIFGASLTEEHIDRITAERRKFFTETQALRDSIRDKRFDIRREMARQDPDEEKVLALQGEVSDLKGQLDRKKIQHQLEIRRILPETATGDAKDAPS
jgi:Spy/CpxP family protein refolding chaperone